MSHLKNIAIVGGSGHAGTPIDSTSTFPDGVQIQKGDYSSLEFLTSALQEQDVLIILLAGLAPKDLQTRLIDAAAAAGVPWVLPCEFSPDTSNPLMADCISVLKEKKNYRDQIETLGKSSWIAVVTGLWFDYSLAGGHFGINIAAQTAKLYDEGTTELTTSTLAQVGRGVTKLLEMPVSNLQQFKNNFVYISSFQVSQMDMLKAVQKATGAKGEDWEITRVPVDEAIAQGTDEMAKENRRGMIDVLYGSNFKPGIGGCFREKSSNAILGLAEENFEETVAGVVESVKTS
ncbi:hypothetical protein BP5796_06613 [Coleophoma crateriformis]|uniref:NmrA-like domain-containing protein n=1 Tax=Coleophoma crateriformis TaxID=565419 RepID=A0A3D8RNW9_9HELO|nr:hypothetical protein BP5796_06613 [Coleophoma crateriformis]